MIVENYLKLRRLKVNVSKEPRRDGIAACRTITVRERLLRFLFGEKKKVTVLIPGDDVAEITISEIKKEEPEAMKGH